MFLVVTCVLTPNASTTNTSQPKTAVFQWLALQRPMRAAMLFERLRGDIAFRLLRWLTQRQSHRSRLCEMRPTGVFAVWPAAPHSGVNPIRRPPGSGGLQEEGG